MSVASSLERNNCSRVFPIFRMIVCPDQDQIIDHESQPRILRNYEEDAWRVVPRTQECGQLSGHRSLIVCDENSAFGRGPRQDRLVIEVIELSGLGGLEINIRLAA